MSVKDSGPKRTKAFLEGLAKISQYRIKVGIQSEDAGSTYDGGATLADVAGFHEFGTDTIPARSFLRAWADTNGEQIQARLRKLAEAVAAGKVDPVSGLKGLGLAFVGQIQARIADGIAPALKPATVARKGSGVPLIDTGVLRSSIRSKVVRVKG